MDGDCRYAYIGFMEFIELVRKRKSVRNYLDTPVEPEKILRCLEAARLAPSACNSQPWDFTVVTSPDKVKILADCSREPVSGLNKWTSQAPAFAVVSAKRPNLTSSLGAFIKDRPFWLMDVGMAAEHFCLQAAEEGLGTCMLGWFDEKKVRMLLDLPRSDRIVLLITLGYPRNPEVSAKTRKPLDSISRIV